MSNYSSRSDVWTRRTTTASVLLVAAIAAIAPVVSFQHMHDLALRHGESELTATLIPLSVDGMIVSSSMSLLLESRNGSRGGVLPWALLIVGSLASLAANVAVAEPTLIGRLIAVWPSFALIGAYETLTRQIRMSVRTACAEPSQNTPETHKIVPHENVDDVDQISGSLADVAVSAGEDRWLQRRAWQWAQRNRNPDGTLRSGAEIGRAFNRSPRWGRLVKQAGTHGELIPGRAGYRPNQTEEEPPGGRGASQGDARWPHGHRRAKVRPGGRGRRAGEGSPGRGERGVGEAAFLRSRSETP